MTDWTQRSWLGNSLLEWALAVGAFAVVSLALRAALAFVSKTAHARVEAGAGRGTKFLADLTRRAHLATVLAVAVAAGSAFLTLPARPEQVLRALIAAVLIAQGASWASTIASLFIHRWFESDGRIDAQEQTLANTLIFVASIAAWLIAGLLFLDNLGVDVTALVAGLGVGGIAVALALQNVLGDLFASLSIILDKPFVVGDFVVVGELMGTVERIGLKTTRVRSLSGEQLVFANSDLLSSRIRNFKRMNERRVVFTVGVVYETAPEALEQIPTIIKEAIEAESGVRFDRSHFFRFGDFSLDFETAFFVQSSDYNTYMDALQRIQLRIFRRFSEKGICFAYPTQTLHLARAARGSLASSAP